MKKILLFAVTLCCMMAATAQKTAENPSLKDRVKKVEQLNRNPEVYTQKLDSMVTSDGLIKLVFQYDNHYNLSKLITQMYGMTLSTTEYFYDDQGRRIRIIESSMYATSVKVEYSYNTQGWVSEEMAYERKGNTWDLDYRITYEYDNNGDVLVATKQDYDNNIWLNEEKEEYTYQSGKVILEMGFEWVVDAWVESDKAEYNYDDHGDLVEALYYDKEDTGWEFERKGVYTYDNHHNCIKEEDYEWDLQNWELYDVLEYTYDWSVPASAIAGLTDSGMTGLGINNKLLKVVVTEYENGYLAQKMIFNLCYSAISTGVDETTEASLNLWPNPACETLSVQAEGLQQVDIFTLDGRRVATVENGFESINVSALSTGCYLLKATLKDGSVCTQKFLKK